MSDEPTYTVADVVSRSVARRLEGRVPAKTMTPEDQRFEALREALVPFAEACRQVELAAFYYDPAYSLHIDDTHAFICVGDDGEPPVASITMGQLRAARAALAAHDQAKESGR